MSIILDNKFGHEPPQTHVLVVGVGTYPHLINGSESKTRPTRESYGLKQLTSPPLSATAFANWLPKLNNGRVPLGTVDLLLSPGEYIRTTGVKETVDLPTMDNLTTAYVSWSDRVNANRDNIGIFYYCGTGKDGQDEAIALRFRRSCCRERQSEDSRFHCHIRLQHFGNECQ